MDVRVAREHRTTTRVMGGLDPGQIGLNRAW
jgi:hypothetical protein